MPVNAAKKTNPLAGFQRWHSGGVSVYRLCSTFAFLSSAKGDQGLLLRFNRLLEGRNSPSHSRAEATCFAISFRRRIPPLPRLKSAHLFFQELIKSRIAARVAPPSSTVVICLSSSPNPKAA